MYVLNECQILASGSTACFLKGKAYKRCKRVHQLLSLAMEIYHFKAFIARQIKSEAINAELLPLVIKMKDIIDLSAVTMPREMIEIKERYDRYKSCT